MKLKDLLSQKLKDLLSQKLKDLLSQNQCLTLRSRGRSRALRSGRSSVIRELEPLPCELMPWTSFQRTQDELQQWYK
jgi:hypothetical protein